MSLINKIRQMVDEAPVAQAGVNVNFGPLAVTPIVKTFHGSGQKPTVLTLEEFAAEQGKSVDDVELGKNDAFNLRFVIDVSDLNEALNFEYTREIPIQESGPKIKTDWSEIVRPSLEAVFGKDWYNVLIGTTKKPAAEVYVAAENVDSLRVGKKNADGEAPKNYGVPKFIAKYKNRDECVRARDARYPKQGEGGQSVDDDEDTDDGDQFPEEVVASAKALLLSNRGNEEKTLKHLSKNPFGNYDAAKLLEAAKAASDDDDE